MMKKNKIRGLALIMTATMLLAGMTACGEKESSLPDLSAMGTVTAVSREEGSGTRDAFETLLNLPETDTGTVAESTEEALKTVEKDENAIAYVAYSAATATEGKILQIDGVAPSEDSISDDSYPLCREYCLAYSGELSEVGQDFLSYVVSEGQDIVGEYCVPVESSKTFLSDQSQGKLVIAGSTSMETMMKSLAEAYQKLNPNAEIEIQATDSSRGLTSAISGECDLAMSSRELKDYESELLETKAIGKDAVAIVVNKENPLESLTTKQLTSLYDGSCEKWSDLS